MSDKIRCVFNDIPVHYKREEKESFTPPLVVRSDPRHPPHAARRSESRSERDADSKPASPIAQLVRALH